MLEAPKQVSDHGPCKRLVSPNECPAPQSLPRLGKGPAAVVSPTDRRCHRALRWLSRHRRDAPSRPSAAVQVPVHRHGLRWETPATGIQGSHLPAAPAVYRKPSGPNCSLVRGGATDLASNRREGERRHAAGPPAARRPPRPASAAAFGKCAPHPTQGPGGHDRRRDATPRQLCHAAARQSMLVGWEAGRCR